MKNNFNYINGSHQTYYWATSYYLYRVGRLKFEWLNKKTKGVSLSFSYKDKKFEVTI